MTAICAYRTLPRHRACDGRAGDAVWPASWRGADLAWAGTTGGSQPWL